MKPAEKFELVLSVFRADSWKPSVDTFDTMKKFLGNDVCNESWFKVFTRDHLYVKNGRVNTRNSGSAQTYLERLIYMNRTPEEEKARGEEKLLAGKFEKLESELREKELRIKELEALVAEKEEKIQSLEDLVIQTKDDIRSKYSEKLKIKNSKIASLSTSKKYWEDKARVLENKLKHAEKITRS